MPDHGTLRIVHCIRAPVGGVFRHVADLAEAQHAAGHSVGLICDSTTGGSFEDRRIKRLEPFLTLGVTRVAMRRQISPSDMIATWRVAKEIRKREPDILHAHGAKGGAYARMIGALLRMNGQKVARFYCPHGGSLHYDPRRLRGRFYFTVERLLEWVTDGLVFVSKFEADTYSAKVGSPRIPSKIVFNGLHREEYEPVRANAEAANFLFIGTLRDLKGPDLFIRAIARLTERRGSTPSAVIVGAGDKKAEYQALSEELGMGSQIEFLDPMPAREAFALAHSVVIPSRAESMPYIVLETIAAQKPIVTTDVGGIPEIFGPESNRLVPPDNVEALTAAMAEIIDDPATAELDAIRRAERLRETFSLSVMAEEVEGFYRTCLPDKAAAATQLPAAENAAGHQMFIRQ